MFVLLLNALLVIAGKSREDTPERAGNSDVISILKVLTALSVYALHTADCIPLPATITHWIADCPFDTEVFFVITGFAIFASLERRDLKTYAIKRFFRIIPLYYSVITILFLYTVLIKHPLPADPRGLGWWRYYLILSTVVPTELDAWVNLCATWSIPAFCWFYVFAPLLKKVVSDFKTAVAAFPVFYLCCQKGLPALFRSIDSLSPKESGILSASFPLIYFCFFMLGACAYYAVKEHKEKEFIVFAAVIQFAQSWFKLGGRLPNSVIVAIVLAAGVRLHLPERLSRVVGVLAKYTFALYLCHPAIWYMSVIFYHQKVFANRFMYGIYLVFLPLIFTYILHHLVEIPAAKLMRRLLLCVAEKG